MDVIDVALCGDLRCNIVVKEVRGAVQVPLYCSVMDQ